MIISEVDFLQNVMSFLLMYSSSGLSIDVFNNKTNINNIINRLKGITGQNIPPARLYPGLKRPGLDYTRVYYGLGQCIPRGILWHRPIHTPSGQIIPSLYQSRYQ